MGTCSQVLSWPSCSTRASTKILTSSVRPTSSSMCSHERVGSDDVSPARPPCGSCASRLCPSPPLDCPAPRSGTATEDSGPAAAPGPPPLAALSCIPLEGWPSRGATKEAAPPTAGIALPSGASAALRLPSISPRRRFFEADSRAEVSLLCVWLHEPTQISENLHPSAKVVRGLQAAAAASALTTHPLLPRRSRNCWEDDGWLHAEA